MAGIDETKMTNELSFLLTREKVDPAIIATLEEVEIVTVKHFAGLAQDEPSFRKMAAKSFKLGGCR